MTAIHQASMRVSNDAGFTLVELLVAMTLLGLLMILVFGGLRFGIKAWEASDAHIAGTDEVRLAQNFIRSEVELAYPKLEMSDPTSPQLIFSGASQSIRFLARVPKSLALAGRAIIELKLSDSGDNRDLVASVRPELSWDDDASALHEERILTGIDSLQFSYFGKTDANSPAAWSETWADKFHLPELIRLSVGFSVGDRRVWPEMIVAPKVSVDVSCQYDMFTKSCRGR